MTPKAAATVPYIEEHPYFKHQQLIVLRNKGIDPESIDAYIGTGGYQAAAKALLDMTPKDIIDQVQISGLRGRGGGGFPTGQKLALPAKLKATSSTCSAMPTRATRRFHGPQCA